MFWEVEVTFYVVDPTDVHDPQLIESLQEGLGAKLRAETRWPLVIYFREENFAMLGAEAGSSPFLAVKVELQPTDGFST